MQVHIRCKLSGHSEAVEVGEEATVGDLRCLAAEVLAVVCAIDLTVPDTGESVGDDAALLAAVGIADGSIVCAAPSTDHTEIVEKVRTGATAYGTLPAYVRGNKEVARAAMSSGVTRPDHTLRLLPPHLLDDAAFVVSLLRLRRFASRHATVRELLLSVLKALQDCLSERLHADAASCAEIAAAVPLAILALPLALRDDDTVADALARGGAGDAHEILGALPADSGVRQRRDVLLAAARHTSRALSVSCAQLRGDRELVRTAVLQGTRGVRRQPLFADGLAVFKCASQELRDDTEFVLELAGHDADSRDVLGYASMRIRSDRALYLRLVGEDPRYLRTAGQSVLQDEEIVLLACARDTKYLADAAHSLRRSRVFSARVARQIREQRRAQGGEVSITSLSSREAQKRRTWCSCM